MGKIYKFDPVVYPRKLWVVVTKDEEYLNKTFRHECDLSGYADRVDAMVFHCSLEETGEYGVAVVFAKKDSMTTKIITHESVPSYSTSAACRWVFQTGRTNISHTSPDGRPTACTK